MNLFKSNLPRGTISNWTRGWFTFKLTTWFTFELFNWSCVVFLNILVNKNAGIIGHPSGDPGSRKIVHFARLFYIFNMHTLPFLNAHLPLDWKDRNKFSNHSSDVFLLMYSLLSGEFQLDVGSPFKLDDTFKQFLNSLLLVYFNFNPDIINNLSKLVCTNSKVITTSLRITRNGSTSTMAKDLLLFQKFGR